MQLLLHPLLNFWLNVACLYWCVFWGWFSVLVGD